MSVHRDLVERLHQAALDPAHWQDFIAGLEQAFPGVKLSIHGLDTRLDQVFLAAHCGFQTPAMASYLEHFHAINPFVTASQSTPFGTVRRSYLDIPDEVLTRTEFYNDWMRPQDDLFGAVALKLQPLAARTLVLAANIRKRDRDTVEPQIQRLFEDLAPHVDHAFQVGEVIAGLESRLARHGGEENSQGCLIVTDGAGKVIWINPEALAAHANLFRIDLFGTLRFSDTEVQDWAAALLRRSRRPPVRPHTMVVHDGVAWCIRASLAELGDLQLPRGSAIFPATINAANPARAVFVISPA